MQFRFQFHWGYQYPNLEETRVFHFMRLESLENCSDSAWGESVTGIPVYGNE